MDAYELLTTTRYDPTLSRFSWNDDGDGPSPFFLLPYHHARLQDAVKHHQWAHTIVPTYTQFKRAIDEITSKQLEVDTPSEPPALRIRILLSKDGDLHVTAVPLEAAFSDDPYLISASPDPQAMLSKSPPLIKVCIDKEPTTPSVFTRTKTTARRVYDDARTRNELSPLTTPDGRITDVLLRDQEDRVTETSIFNVAFLRDSIWVTPASGVGCLPGVARRWLLENKRIVEDLEGTLNVTNIVEGEQVLLFNGVQGCRLGIITKAP